MADTDKKSETEQPAKEERFKQALHDDANLHANLTELDNPVEKMLADLELKKRISQKRSPTGDELPAHDLIRDINQIQFRTAKHLEQIDKLLRLTDNDENH